MYSRKELQNMTNEQLLRLHENLCFAICHKETKRNSINLDRVKEEILQRLNRNT